jgi:putative spermidine/putrescine transport system permease protein
MAGDDGLDAALRSALGGAPAAATTVRTRGGRSGRLVASGLALLVGVPLLLLPVQAAADRWRAPALLPQQWGTRGLDVLLAPGTDAIAATTNALLVGVAATTVALLLGWPAARWLAVAPTRRRVVVLVLLALPLLVPPYAVGTGLVEWFLRLGLADTRTGLVLSHLVAVLPYLVVVLAPAFGPDVRRLEEAAAILGADPRRVLLKVTLPAVAPTLAVALLLGFLVSWSQYGTSLAVGAGIPMLPVVLEPFVGRDPQVAAVLGLVFLAPPLLALVVTVRRTARR